MSMRATAIGRVALAMAVVAVAGVGAVGGARAQDGGSVSGRGGTLPAEGIRDRFPGVHALVGGTVVVGAGGKRIERGVVVVRDGRIVAVGAVGETVVPAEARVHDLAGKVIYPGLIDAYTEFAEGGGSGAGGAGGSLLVDAPARGGTAAAAGGGGGRGGVGYWNSRVTPEMRVSRVYRSGGGGGGGGTGIVARLAAPTRGVVKGVSALVFTGERSGREALVREGGALHVALTPGVRGFGGGTEATAERYPNSPMGAMTLVRQAMYDAQWHAAAWAAVEKNVALPRPERNEALAAITELVASKTPVMVDAQDELYVLRAAAVGREFGVRVIVRGSGQEYRLAGEIAKAVKAGEIEAVVVPVAFPRAPVVASPEQARAVTLMDLMSWDLSPENPARLEAAGVPIAFTSQGLSAARGETLLGQVRKAVRRGLSEEAALRALTITPAKLFGAEGELGTIEAGKSASFVVTDGELFAERTKVLETWVDGEREVVPPATPTSPTTAPSGDPRGTWEVTIGTWKGTLTLPVPAAGGARLVAVAVPGSATAPATTAATSPSTTRAARGAGGAGGGELKALNIIDTRISFTVAGEAIGGAGGAGVAGVAVVSATVVGDRLLGSVLLPDGSSREMVGVRGAAGAATRPATTRAVGGAGGTGGAATRPAMFAPNWPLGEYGRDGLPAQPERVLFRNATVWTGEAEGVLAGASVLVEKGKIVRVFKAGEALPEGEGLTFVDCTGKHLTAGVIDAHSHMATDGGINESGQTITAEVRIADYLDPTDINIYRQLAGGTTSALVLHGSANTIGGQSQAIKLRWGATPEQLKFEGAPDGIKFALGENPKQSNWGAEATGRYPQTRMGVEQLVRDAFAAARAYAEAWKKYQADPAAYVAAGNLPPRKDLELEAVAEILAGSRWIHSHAYRQDEILALIRTTREAGVTIGSFQHVLEGYKVADELARNGITASGFTDWWAFKVEVMDAIPYSPAIMWKQGVVASLNSDDAELGRRLNLEAGKVVKYGNVPEHEAWKMVTLNPAKSLRIDDRVGSIRAGKDADLVVWSGPPMSNFTRAEQTWVDGRAYFTLELDAAKRAENTRRHAALLQRALGSAEPSGTDDAPGTPATPPKLWPNYDAFCGASAAKRQRE